MRIVFVYSDYSGQYGYWNSKRYTPSVASLSAYLKLRGIDSALVHISSNISRYDFLSQLNKHKQDILAFTAISMSFFQIRKLASWAKQEINVPTILGGVHATLSPEDSISSGYFDYVCRGEGENALREVCRRLQNNIEITNIPNLWIRRNGEIEKNQVGPLIECLDKLPIPDWEIFDLENVTDFYHLKSIPVLASRGCPYNCTYCANHAIKAIYPNKNRYTRFRSVNSVIEEIEERKTKYPWLTNVRFLDDTLALNKDWFLEFTAEYMKRIDMPFSCNERINHLDDDVVASYKRAGCFLLEVGIESGNEEVRNKIMRRGISNGDIQKALTLCKRYEIGLNTFNIIGVPGESLRQSLETIEINARYRPRIAKYFYYKPLPATVLSELCRTKKFVLPGDSLSLYDGPAIETNIFSACDQMFIFKYKGIIAFVFQLFDFFPVSVRQKSVNIFSSILTSRFFPRKTLVYLSPILVWNRLKIQNILARWPWLYRYAKAIWRFLIRK